EQVRTQLEIPSEYFVSRGFSGPVLDALDVGHSERLGMTVVPLYDRRGEVCVGFVSRRETSGCQHGQRWSMMEGFPKGKYLSNLPAASQSPRPYVLLVEGAPDVFRAAEAGCPAVALLGSELSDAQADLLASLGKEILIATDNDEAGKRCAVAAGQRLK